MEETAVSPKPSPSSTQLMISGKKKWSETKKAEWRSQNPATAIIERPCRSGGR